MCCRRNSCTEFAGKHRLKTRDLENKALPAPGNKIVNPIGSTRTELGVMLKSD